MFDARHVLSCCANVSSLLLVFENLAGGYRPCFVQAVNDTAVLEQCGRLLTLLVLPRVHRIISQQAPAGGGGFERRDSNDAFSVPRNSKISFVSAQQQQQ